MCESRQNLSTSFQVPIQISNESLKLKLETKLQISPKLSSFERTRERRVNALMSELILSEI